MLTSYYLPKYLLVIQVDLFQHVSTLALLDYVQLVTFTLVSGRVDFLYEDSLLIVAGVA